MSADRSHGSDAEALVLTEDSAGRPGAARVGQQVRLALRENPTTGYRWVLTEACATHLQAEGDSFAPGGSTPGAGGEHTWVFRAREPGSCELKLHSARAWEKTPGGAGLVFPLVIQGA